jgi:hypothetical protein
VCGALNLYYTTAASLTVPALRTGLLAAEQAGLLFGAVVDRSRDRAHIERLRSGADRDRSAVDRAVGILMAQRGCDEQQAFTVLEEAADAAGSDVASVAAKLVSTVAARAKNQR